VRAAMPEKVSVPFELVKLPGARPCPTIAGKPG
jgi:hypothetical protein